MKNIKRILFIVVILSVLIFSFIMIGKKSKKIEKAPEKIVEVDKVSPVITLKGNQEVTITVGDKYVELGYTAVDDKDGDITSKVMVTNNIKDSVGNYEVEYKVSDNAGNLTSVVRKVIVKKKEIKKASNSSSKSNTKKTGLAVLMYHYFYDSSKGESGKNSNWQDVSSFESQLKYLKENNYYFPTWQEVYNFVDGKITLPKKSVVITIDDGHDSLFEKAIPLLEKYKVPATAFIITSKEAGTKFTKYKSEYISFQSHTHNMHRGGCSGGHGGLFRCISYEKGLADLNQSISILQTSDALAYPYGDVTSSTLKIMKASKFKLAFTTKYGKVYKGMDKLQLPRVRISKGISLKGFINSI